MRARALVVLAVVAALALPLGASADPKPAGCAGVVQVTGASCTFVLEAGNDGHYGYHMLALSSATATARLDLLRGNTVVASTGDIRDELGSYSARFDQGSPLSAGTYRCRITSSGPVVAVTYSCYAA